MQMKHARFTAAQMHLERAGVTAAHQSSGSEAAQQGSTPTPPDQASFAETHAEYAGPTAAQTHFGARSLHAGAAVARG